MLGSNFELFWIFNIVIFLVMHTSVGKIGGKTWWAVSTKRDGPSVGGKSLVALFTVSVANLLCQSKYPSSELPSPPVN